MADDIGRVLDALAEQFAPHPGSLHRTALPGNVPRQAGEEDLDEERLLLATATAYPAEVQQMRWLTEADFLLPLHAALWQSITALVHRGDMVDPVTVLGEAQHRGLLTDSLTPKDLMALVSTPAGSPDHWGEKILNHALLVRAQTVAARITAYTDDPADTPTSSPPAATAPWPTSTPCAQAGSAPPHPPPRPPPVHRRGRRRVLGPDRHTTSHRLSALPPMTSRPGPAGPYGRPELESSPPPCPAVPSDTHVRLDTHHRSAQALPATGRSEILGTHHGPHPHCSRRAALGRPSPWP